MIRTHLPQGVVSLHAFAANDRIDQAVLEGMAHMQGAGNIGRRDCN